MSASRRNPLLFPFAAERCRRFWTYRPLLSVVLPVYNQAQYLPQSVRSVLEQEGVALELIVVDDGSTDDVAGTLRSWQGDARLRIVSQENRGLSSALNAGFALARGDLLTWTSADNYYLPNALRMMSDFLLANPSVGMVYANVALVDDSGRAVEQSNYRPQDQNPADRSQLLLPADAQTLSEMPDNFINACFLYRRELRDMVGPYSPSLRGVEDYDYWLRIGAVSRIAHLDYEPPLYHYRLHGNTLTSVIPVDGLIRQTEELLRSHRAWQDRHRLAGGHRALQLLPLNEDEERSNEPPPAPLGTPAANRSLTISFAGEGESSPDAQAFRPAGFPADLNYEHTALLRLHGGYRFAPFIIAGQEPPLDRLRAGSVVLPPLHPPPLLRRARSSNFGAITLHDGALCAATMLLPALEGTELEQYATAAAQLVQSLPRITFAFVGASEEELRTAEAVRARLDSEGNIRVLDITNELAAESSTSVPSPYDRAMMFILSASNLCIYLDPRDFGLEAALELRAQAALAAAAGLGILCLCGPLEPRTTWTVEDWLENQAIPDRLCGLSGYLLPIPHLGLLEWRPNEAEFFEDVQEMCRAIASGIDLASAEQWLDAQSAERALARIGHVLLAKWS